MCSAHYSDTYIVEAFRRGAWGYVLKALAGDRLINAIRAVESGEWVFYNNFIDDPGEEYLGNDARTTLRCLRRSPIGSETYSYL